MAQSTAIALHASAPETANSASAAVDLVQATTVELTLAIASAGGTLPTLLVAIETSSDNVNWTTLGAFTVASIAGFQKLVLPGASRWVRARWTITGSAGQTFTFSVGGLAFVVLATPADLVTFGPPNAAFDALTAAEQDRFLRAASDKALGYVQNHKSLPLLAWGDDLRSAVVQLATWSIFSGKIGFNPEAGTDTAIRLNYTDAVKWLTQVAEGTVELADCVDSTPDVEDDGGAVVASDFAPRGWV